MPNFIVHSHFISYLSLEIIFDFEVKKWSIWDETSERREMIDFYKY